MFENNYFGYPQYYEFTRAEIGLDRAIIKIRSVPSKNVVFLSPFGVNLTMNFVKVSGVWQISSVEGGVFPEG